MIPRSGFLLLAVLCLCVFVPAHLTASTVAPPTDLGELLHLSDAVVLAEAGASWGEPGGLFPYTATRFYLLEQAAGRKVGAIFEVHEMGGEAAGERVAVSGSPEFVEGRRYLLFLQRDEAGRWRPRMLSYGLLEESPDGSLLRPLEAVAAIALVPLGGRGRIEPVGTYRKGDLLRHLGEVAKGARWQGGKALAGAADLAEALVDAKDGSSSAGGDLVAVAAASLQPAACTFLSVSQIPFRWFGFEGGAATATIWATTPGQLGLADGGAGAVRQGVAAWTNHADSAIRFQYGGVRAGQVSCTTGSTSDKDPGGVLFNDPCGDIVDLSTNCAGTLARGGVAAGGGQATYDGATWYTITSPFVVVNNGAACVNNYNPANFAEMMTHELGHSLGFGHHAVATAPNNPTMSGTLKGDGRGAALVGADKTCAAYAYHTFLDVPYDYLFWSHIEAVENAGIANGCSASSYCPTANITRAQMATFLVRGIHGGSFVPPPATGMFEDVPAGYWAAAHIEQLARDGITKGCGVSPARFCPEGLINRSQMAIFLMRVEHGINFVPPPATGTVFGDVPASYWAGAEIEQVYRDGITNGCSASPARFCPENQVNRGSMAAFLARVFNLPLP